jgi:hypothetical protein
VPRKIGAHLNQPHILHLLDMAGQRPIGDIQIRGNLIHIHFLVFQQQLNDIHPHLGT